MSIEFTTNLNNIHLTHLQDTLKKCTEENNNRRLHDLFEDIMTNLDDDSAFETNPSFEFYQNTHAFSIVNMENVPSKDLLRNQSNNNNQSAWSDVCGKRENSELLKMIQIVFSLATNATVENPLVVPLKRSNATESRLEGYIFSVERLQIVEGIYRKMKYMNLPNYFNGPYPSLSQQLKEEIAKENHEKYRDKDILSLVTEHLPMKTLHELTPTTYREIQGYRLVNRMSQSFSADYPYYLVTQLFIHHTFLGEPTTTFHPLSTYVIPLRKTSGGNLKMLDGHFTSAVAFDYLDIDRTLQMNLAQLFADSLTSTNRDDVLYDLSQFCYGFCHSEPRGPHSEKYLVHILSLLSTHHQLDIDFQDLDFSFLHEAAIRLSPSDFDTYFKNTFSRQLASPTVSSEIVQQTKIKSEENKLSPKSKKGNRTVTQKKQKIEQPSPTTKITTTSTTQIDSEANTEDDETLNGQNG